MIQNLGPYTKSIDSLKREGRVDEQKNKMFVQR